MTMKGQVYRITTATMLLVMLFLATLTNVSAQQAPFFETKKFETASSHRTDLCERHRQIYSNTIKLEDALRGLNLSVVLTDYKNPIDKRFFTLNGKGVIDPSEVPLFAKILDELGRRAGFSWRNSFGVVTPIDSLEDGNRTWSDLLEWEVDTYDIAMGKWDRTRERMSNQIAFPEGWYDASIIMIEYTDPQSTTTDLDLFSFLTPFEWTVWMLILATIVASGLVYYLLEKMNTASDERTLEEAPVSAVYYSAITFTGHLEFRPQTHAARLVAFSLSFSALIVAAAYTANLASFLVARRQPSSTLQSIQDAVAQRAPICLQASVALDQYITNQYPSAVLVRNYSESDVFEGLVQGECRVAVVPKYSYETYLKNSEINSDCGLTWQGRVEKFVPSGLASRVDTGNLCTSLVSHVLDLHLLEMDADGFLDVVWEEHIQRVGNQNCLVESSGPTGELEDDTYSLSIQEMAGIFIVHTVLTSIAVLLAIFQFFMEKRRAVVEPTERRDNTLLTEAPQVNGSQATISTNGKQPAACGEEAPPSTVGLIGDAFYHNAETIEV